MHDVNSEKRIFVGPLKSHLFGGRISATTKHAWAFFVLRHSLYKMECKIRSVSEENDSLATISVSVFFTSFLLEIKGRRLCPKSKNTGCIPVSLAVHKYFL